jgi:hypothetical protein
MLVMAVLLLAGTTFLTLSSTETQIAVNEAAGAQALGLADAALARAIARLNAGTPTLPYTETASLGRGQLRLTVTAAAAQPCAQALGRDVAAAGTVAVSGPTGGAAETQVRATLDKIAYPFRWAAFAAVPNTIVSGERVNKELWLRSAAESPTSTDGFDSSRGDYSPTANRNGAGHVGANGDVTLDPGAVVNGSVRAGDDLVRTGATVNGAAVTGLSPGATPAQPFPLVGPPWPPSGGYAASGSIRTAGTYVLDWLTLAPGATITASGPLTIYVTGSLTIGDGATIGSPDDPSRWITVVKSETAEGETPTSAVFGNDVTFRGAFYGRNADVWFGARTRIYGSVVARTVAVGPGSELHYDQALGDHELCLGGSARYAIRRGTWREVMP